MSLNQETFLPNNIFFTEVKNILDKHKSIRIRVRGNSMLPFIRHNDAVLLVSPVLDKIRKGAIVVAKTDEIGYVMHRIVAVDGDILTLLGDGNVNQFEHSDISRVIAIVVRYDRGKYSFSTESLGFRIIGLLWINMHPWRKNLVSFLWKLKTKLLKVRKYETKK